MVRWAAPELISGKFYTLKSDVYSMGLFLWELKYRKMAFHEVFSFFFSFFFFLLFVSKYYFFEKKMILFCPQFTGRWVNEEIKDAVIQGRRPSPVDESPYDLLAKVFQCFLIC